MNRKVEAIKGKLNKKRVFNNKQRTEHLNENKKVKKTFMYKGISYMNDVNAVSTLVIKCGRHSFQLALLFSNQNKG